MAACLAGHDTTYARVRFEGNGKAVAYWDANARYGLVMIDDKTEKNLESFAPAWPDWHARVDELQAELTGNGSAELSA